MTAKKLQTVMAAMELYGIAKLRLGDCEITRGGTEALRASDPARLVVAPEAQLTAEQEANIKHKVDELKSVMQLGDEELLDRLFPKGDDEEPVMQQ